MLPAFDKLEPRLVSVPSIAISAICADAPTTRLRDVLAADGSGRAVATCAGKSIREMCCNICANRVSSTAHSPKYWSRFTAAGSRPVVSISIVGRLAIVGSLLVR